jgi:hypothetical protein
MESKAKIGDRTQEEDDEIPKNPLCSAGSDPGTAPDGLPAEQPGPSDYAPTDAPNEPRTDDFPPAPASIGSHVSAPTTFKPIC